MYRFPEGRVTIDKQTHRIRYCSRNKCLHEGVQSCCHYTAGVHLDSGHHCWCHLRKVDLAEENIHKVTRKTGEQTAPLSSSRASAGYSVQAGVYLDVLAPVLQQSMLTPFHPAEQLVHLGEVRNPVLIQQVVEP